MLEKRILKPRMAISAKRGRNSGGGDVSDVDGPPIESPDAWWRYNSSIIVTGSGVSQWGDASGNGHPLLQAVDSRRPTLQPGGEIRFNGTSHFLNTASWVLAQPITVYFLLKQITWTAEDYIFGNGQGSTSAMILRQIGTTPQLSLYAGTSNSTLNGTLALNTYAPLAAVFNGASSLIHVNGQAATGTSGSIGTNGLVTFCLGAQQFPFSWSNIEAKEGLVYAAAHDATQRQTVFDYLASI